MSTFPSKADRNAPASDQLYLDHAATSFPKPPCVGEAMLDALATAGNAGRSAHSLALEGARILLRLRVSAGKLFGVGDAKRVVFTPGCTYGLNLVLRSLPAGSHVVTTSMEHNAVARALTALAHRGQIEFTRVPSSAQGLVSPFDLASACTPRTRLAVVNHASNVCGAIQDIVRIREVLPPHVRLLVDASQTAGMAPIRVDANGLDYVAVSGHKGVLGPSGTGLLLIGSDAPSLEPLVCGGTGSASDSDRMPDFLPDALEAGTPNLPGAAGLRAGIEWVLARGIEQIVQQEQQFSQRFLEGVHSLKGVRLVGPDDVSTRTATFSLQLHDMDPGEVALRLEREFGILVRSGLHCAPWAHQTLGTLPQGTVRISWGATAPSDAAPRVIEAISHLVQDRP